MHYREPPFTLRQAQYLIAVAETGGFGAAAEACGVSQPSLSAQVKKVEDQLGLLVFDRHPRGVRLTEAGEALLPAFQSLLGHADGLVRASRSLLDPTDVTLRIGLIPTVAPYLLPPLVALPEEGSMPRYHWLELQTADCEDGLLQGTLDGAVIAEAPRHPSLTGREVGFEPFMVVVPQQASLQGPVRLEDLDDENVLLLDQGHCLRDQTLALCMRPGARTSPFRATSLGTLTQMVAAGLGITVLPRSAAAIEQQRASLRVLPFASDPPPGRHLHVVWRNRSPHAPLLERLASRLARVI